jgi:hypothetical protein
MMHLKRSFVLVIVVTVLFSSLCLSRTQGNPGRESVVIPSQPLPFYDTPILLKAFEEKQKSVVENILKKYTDKTLEQMKNEPFIGEFIRELLVSIENKIIETVQGEMEVKMEETPQTYAVGFPSPVTVVEGLALFVAERFKDELTIAYLDDFGKFLKKHKDLNLLFPSTYSVLLNNDPFNFKSFLTTLREGFLNDFQRLDAGGLAYLKAKYREEESHLRQPEKEALVWAVLGLEFFERLKWGDHPVGVIDTLDTWEWVEKLDKKSRNYIKLLALLSRSLTNKESSGWITPGEFMTLLGGKSADKLRQIYIGLIYLKEGKTMNSICFNTHTGESKCLADILASSEKRIEEFNEWLYRLTQLGKRVEDTLRSLKGNGPEYSYTYYLETVYQIFDFLLDDTLARFVDPAAREKIHEYTTILKKVVNICKDINQKWYGLALTEVLGIVDIILPAQSELREVIGKYGMFIVNVINSRSPEDTRNALDAAALPVGSYRLKRSSGFSVALNAYAGIFGSYENLLTRQPLKESENKKEPNIGFTAPVGLAFSFSGGTFNKPKPSVSIFFSVIDVGVVVSYRLSGHDKGLPELHFKNILAPGIYLLYGFRKSPLCLGLACQYGPQLRKVTAENGLEIETSAFRFGITVVVDIPVFNFYASK